VWGPVTASTRCITTQNNIHQHPDLVKQLAGCRHNSQALLWPRRVQISYSVPGRTRRADSLKYWCIWFPINLKK
jgi:hypothetical protein